MSHFAAVKKEFFKSRVFGLRPSGGLVGSSRFELETFRMSSERSNQLSYEPVKYETN